MQLGLYEITTISHIFWRTASNMFFESDMTIFGDSWKFLFSYFQKYVPHEKLYVEET